jgi:hypothetical protein
LLPQLKFCRDGVAADVAAADVVAADVVELNAMAAAASPIPRVPAKARRVRLAEKRDLVPTAVM